ncbi:MAG: RidA family protein [Oscillospiraceae bacterium]|nr:RidA family protein [Oscillospiraceae bacterium]
MLSYVNTNDAPQAIGPYSQAIVFGNMMFTSGQIPLDPVTGAVAGASIEEQALQVMKNLSAVFKAQNTGFENVIKTTCFLADMKDFAAFNKIYGEYFTGKPARSCVAVKELPKNVLCEVEAIVALN